MGLEALFFLCQRETSSSFYDLIDTRLSKRKKKLLQLTEKMEKNNDNDREKSDFSLCCKRENLACVILFPRRENYFFKAREGKKKWIYGRMIVCDECSRKRVKILYENRVTMTFS